MTFPEVVSVTTENAFSMKTLQAITCGNCGRMRHVHVDGKCLFESTCFESIAWDALRLWAQQHFTRQSNLDGYIRRVIENEDGHGDNAVIKIRRDGSCLP